jgi:hypothetical protein
VKKYVKNGRRTRRGGIFKKGWNISKGTANMLGLRTPSKDRIDNDQGKGQKTSLSLDEVFYTRKRDEIISMFKSGNKVLFVELKEKMILAIELLRKCIEDCLKKNNCSETCNPEEKCKDDPLCNDIRTITNKKPNYAAPNFCNQYLIDSENCRDYLTLLQRLINYREAYKQAPQVSESFSELIEQLRFFSDSVKDLDGFSLEKKRRLLKICNIMNLYGEMFQQRNQKTIHKQILFIHQMKTHTQIFLLFLPLTMYKVVLVFYSNYFPY